MNKKPFLLGLGINRKKQMRRQYLKHHSCWFSTSIPPSIILPRHLLWPEISPLVWGRAKSKRKSVKTSWSFISSCSVRPLLRKAKLTLAEYVLETQLTVLRHAQGTGEAGSTVEHGWATSTGREGWLSQAEARGLRGYQSSCKGGVKRNF